jgi:hypothetical protein
MGETLVVMPNKLTPARPANLLAGFFFASRAKFGARYTHFLHPGGLTVKINGQLPRFFTVKKTVNLRCSSRTTPQF